MRILLVEDETKVSSFLARGLMAERFAVDVIADGQSGLELATTYHYDLVILDGPAMPWSPADRKLLDIAEGLVAILPVYLDINDSMEDVIAALGGAERKLVGVVLSEVNPTAVSLQRDKQYA